MTGRKSKVGRFQRVGGRCEPIGRLDRCSSPSRRETSGEIRRVDSDGISRNRERAESGATSGRFSSKRVVPRSKDFVSFTQRVFHAA